MADISNREDVIDSRDIIERIEELESTCLPFRASLVYNDGETPTETEDFATWEEAREFLHGLSTDIEGDDGDALYALLLKIDGEPMPLALVAGALSADIIVNPDVDEDEADELKTLKAFAGEAEDYAADWEHGATLVRESYFTEYCKDLSDDIGDLPKGIPSYIAIDWDKTADNLRVDYTEIDYDGVTYLVR